MKEESFFSSIPDIKYSEPAIETNSLEFEKVVRSRRSVRVYTDEKIPEDITKKCLELALLAPNSSNLQQFEFHWVKSVDKKNKLHEYCMGQAAARTAAEIFVCVGRTGTYKKHCVEMLKAFEATGEKIPASHHDMQMWAAKSAALACENLMLAFRAYGYDTCPMEGFDEARVARLLDLPSDAFCVMVISAGRRASNGVYGPQIRFPSDWFIIEK